MLSTDAHTHTHRHIDPISKIAPLFSAVDTHIHTHIYLHSTFKPHPSVHPPKCYLFLILAFALICTPNIRFDSANTLSFFLGCKQRSPTKDAKGKATHPSTDKLIIAITSNKQQCHTYRSTHPHTQRHLCHLSIDSLSFLSFFKSYPLQPVMMSKIPALFFLLFVFRL